MSISLVQKTSATGANTTSVAKAFASPNTAGNLLIAVMAWDRTNRTFTSISDTQGNTWHLAGSAENSANGAMALRLMYAENCKVGPNTVTVRTSGGDNISLSIFEYSGVLIAASLDAASGATNTTANPTTPSITTTASGDLVFACCGVSSTTAPTAGTGYTSELGVTFTTSTSLCEDQIPAGTGSFTGSFVHAAATYCTSIAAFFAVATPTETDGEMVASQQMGCCCMPNPVSVVGY